MARCSKSKNNIYNTMVHFIFLIGDVMVKVHKIWKKFMFKMIVYSEIGEL